MTTDPGYILVGIPGERFAVRQSDLRSFMATVESNSHLPPQQLNAMRATFNNSVPLTDCDGRNRSREWFEEALALLQHEFDITIGVDE